MEKIVLIVGASGVGKDTLIRNIKEKIDANFIQRYITRIPDTNESNFYLDIKAFELLKTKEYFVSTWGAHENLYGIAKEHIIKGLNIISISRGAIKDFEEHYEDVTTINITIPKELLYKRLQQRGRESQEAIEKRVARSYEKIEAKRLIDFDNSDLLENSIEKFLDLLQSIKSEK